MGKNAALKEQASPRTPSSLSSSQAARRSESGKVKTPSVRVRATLSDLYRHSHGRETGLPVVISVLILIGLLTAIVISRPQTSSTSQKVFNGSVASPQVRTVIQLGSPDQYPRQLAYDATRNGIWFWTSTQQRGTQFDNRIYFYDIATDRTAWWPLYSADWSSQVLAGLSVAPNGDIWVGWNLNLVDFHPSTGRYERYALPALPKYPLPAAVIGDLPSNLGVSDLKVGSDGVVWIARYGALSLLSYAPKSATFTEYQLPANAGDPAKLAIGPDGHIFFTVNFSASHPGYLAESVGEFNPVNSRARIYVQGAESLAVSSTGDLFTALMGGGPGLARLSAVERTSAATQGRSANFNQRIVRHDIDDKAIAVDGRGRIWVALAGQPQIGVYDTATGSLQVFQYAAPSILAHPADTHGQQRVQAAPGAVWLRHIVEMVTDGQGHLWYVRAGYSSLEEISA